MSGILRPAGLEVFGIGSGDEICPEGSTRLCQNITTCSEHTGDEDGILFAWGLVMCILTSQNRQVP